MPVRIYDIAKKLGIESKQVLARAHELGITTAKVPSSSLDKITAAYLEEQLGGTVPIAPAAASVAPPPEPVVVLTAATEPAPPAAEVAPPPPAELSSPAPPVIPPAEAVAPPSPAVVAPEVPATPEPAPEVAPPSPEPPASPEVDTPMSLIAEPPTAISTPVAELPPPPPIAPPPPPPPPKPAVPQLGEKIGFIQLPQRPPPRTAAGKPPPRPPAPPARSARPGVPPPSAKPPARAAATPSQPKFVPPAGGEVITLKPPVVVRELAEKLNRKPFQIIADLMELGEFATVNQAIGESAAQRVCAKYGFRFEVEKRDRGGGIVHAPKRPVERDPEDKPEDLKMRAPVVTIMGHVDHGKTTLLDRIRKSNVAAREAGGITQHIGAYTIAIPHPERKKELQQITFLDTPGHAAFSAMRARGANVTDIVILVVAANDGVMPQTLEAISHAQAAKVLIMVAVNKCDHPNANSMKTRQQLQDKGLVCEEWGGNTIFVDCSGLTGQGVDKLLEMLVLQAEVMELKANPNRAAKGNIIESGLEPGGPTATVLVRKGTLRLGDAVLCGPHWGRVRALINEDGKRLKEAGPSVAVKILGLSGVPEAGEEFAVLDNEKDARSMAEEKAAELRDLENRGLAPEKPTLETIFQTLEAEDHKVLRVVVKADTQGSAEAIVDALKKVPQNKVGLEVLHSAVGTVTESDVMLATASRAVILGFHTRIDTGVSEAAKHRGVQIKLYSIIYELIDEVQDAMAGLLDPLLKEVVIGAAEVRKIFTLSKGGNVAGCVVASGRITKGRMRVMRRKGLIFEGLSASLRRFQDEVNEVRAGMECGIRLDGFNDFQVGDSIECYTTEKVAQKL